MNSARARTVAEMATAQAGIAEMDMIPGYGWDAEGVLSDVYNYESLVLCIRLAHLQYICLEVNMVRVDITDGYGRKQQCMIGFYLVADGSVPRPWCCQNIPLTLSVWLGRHEVQAHVSQAGGACVTLNPVSKIDLYADGHGRTCNMLQFS